ncbi:MULTISPECIES: DEAD/DEAH box helicase [Leuconostoc]|jgi:ATP-dependent RNA helicase CshB|uniref:DEAD-box ATP-dependent RNA helicase CshB n=2 Tax=Leuconostoc gelidum group TaxID=3016637 RepID=A0A9Q3T054_9LACO|nr:MULTISPECIES: DEAD/DEAH box helicase [Leuconostoc]MBR2276344.1 DEAD/DEAH box helicase [Leuconostoc sp.]AFS40087.1 ATP-dependent RNA helicase/autoaggregation-mediating protein [Leuconostoc gelidum JB7]MBZ5943476.1 DEAD/DEAH box helicase [Leuconostoc gasicomitatum]MBZ5946380.1 DEAD/DEAH box helicase [Leuconostoc gasicomitatum]MBZ5948459.1 DEAD/DEAH box helicase [Leuconostoc gasicomitatum]
MAETANQFGQFNLKPEIIVALTKIGFTQPTPVQAKLIPSILQGNDVVGQSQTGSGKTHTFLIPILNQLSQNEQYVQAVITTPSRELAAQITKAAKDFAESWQQNVTISEFVGGTDKMRQIKQLEKGQPQIVIGTPGRIKDLVSTGALKLHAVHTLVVDEADMTLDMGFLSEVDFIAGAMPDKLQTLVFSATMPEKLKPFLKKYLDNPKFEAIPVSTVIADTIDNWLLATKSKNRNDVIYQVLSIGNPYLALVFANTKERAKEIASNLRGRGLKVAEIHGDIEPRERRRVMKAIQNLEFQYVVATDLAARGIDIEGVSHVINDDIPDELEFFVHRVGRTGRNGLAGLAITLYGPDEEQEVAELEALGINFKAKQIKDGEIVDVKDRRARKQRVATTKKLDPTMVGMVKKKKKIVKPGYKRRIKSAIQRKDQMDRRISKREEMRATRKENKKRGDR